MKQLLLIILILISISSKSQDTLKVLNSDLSSCGSFFVDTIPENAILNTDERIRTYKESGDTIFIEAIVKLNCSFENINIETIIKYSNDTINIVLNKVPDIHYDSIFNKEGELIEVYSITTESEDECSCNFCYKLSYLKEKSNSDKFFLNEKFLPIIEGNFNQPDIPYLVYLGDTVNYYDKYGRKQGLHIKLDSLNRINLKIQYKDDIETERRKDITYYYNGNLKSYYDMLKVGRIYKTTYKELYKNGLKKKACNCPHWKFCEDFPSSYCYEWNKIGDLIKEPEE